MTEGDPDATAGDVDHPGVTDSPQRATRGRWAQLWAAYSGRHTAASAGALEELDALPLPAWGTFLGIVLGALGALSGVVYGVLFGSDHRWALLVLAVAWTVLGAALTAAAVRLRRHEPIAAAVVYLGSSACVAGGLALLACGAARNGAILAVLGLALAVGATLELRGGVTSARYPARHG